MTNKLLAISLIFLLLILISGCIGLGYGDTWRTYDNAGSKNVTINIYKTDKDNLTILESGLDNIQVKEDVFYEKRSWVKNDTGNAVLIDDYVRFNGDKDNLTINISLARTSAEDSQTYKAYANVFVYLPRGTNHTINNVDYDEATAGGITFDESVKSGSTVIDKVELSAEEKVKLATLINNTAEEVKQEFETKYSAWKAMWDDPALIVHSNPEMFTRSGQYSEFLAYCKKQDKAVWPLLFQKYVQGDERAEAIVSGPLINLTYNEYGYLLDEIREESTKERYNDQGAYIAPSAEANMMRYIKKLLELL